MPLKIPSTSQVAFAISTKEDFELLFRANYSTLCAYANGFLRDPDASEDVVQEVMFRLWNGKERLTIDTSIRSYLFRSVRNGCMNFLKHLETRSAFQKYREHMGELFQESSEEILVGTELQNRIRDAIDRLPMERRKVFILSRYENLTYQQISEKLGISVKTVENQMGAALKTMRKELQEFLPWIILFLLDF